MTIFRIPVLLGLAITALLAGQLRADLATVMAEPKLERRARKAMENANEMLEVSTTAYLAGDTENHRAALEEVRESVELTYKSLRDTGKKPRKNAKHYKRAEIGSRKLLRRLDTFRNQMSYTERDQIDEVIKAIQEIHGKLLNDVMGGGQ